MTAIVELSGRQYKLEKDQIFFSELTNIEIGTEFVTDKVLMISDGDKIQIGKPYIANAKMKLKVLESVKGPKLTGFKYKRRKNYHRKWGHRQTYDRLQVIQISA